MKVAEIASPRIVSAESWESMDVAAGRMRDNDVGAVAVLEHGRTVAIFTERDLVRAIADGVDPAKIPVADYASHDIVSIPPDLTSRVAVSVMLDMAVRHLPVMRDGDLIGMVSIRDVLEDLFGKPAEGDGPTLRVLLDQRVAVVRSKGAPAGAAARAIPALYASFMALQHDRGTEDALPMLRARWPNAHTASQSEWVGLWALPIADDVSTMPQATPGVEVEVQTWTYGTVAEITHHGPYETETADVADLHQFIEAHGYEIDGPHEEEYLTPPGTPDQRTIIRHAVRPKG